MLRKWPLILTLIAGLVMFGVGCSNDDDDNGVDKLSAPAGLAADANEDVVTFTWNAVTNASGYRLQVASDNAFANLIADENVSGTQYVWEDVAENTYYARIAAIGNDDYGNSDFSSSIEVDVTGETGIVILTGTISEDMTLDADREYLLRGGVFVGAHEGTDRVTLTIPAGTMIYGESSTYGMLVITRGGRIDAQGTADAPIIFTSDQPEGQRSAEDWGGVIINGRAPLNTGDEALGEGGTGPYGGEDPADNSGILRYCRIEFAGREISPDNELNGLALQGVGYGTTLEYIQVHMNKDDGIEFFGGAARAKYIYITGAADDQFDWTDGWQGKGQFWVCQQYADDADQGIEADNSGEDNSATPWSNPTIYNLTLIGAVDMNNDESDIGMLLREGTKAHIYNAIVANFGESGVDIDEEQTWQHAQAGDLVVDNSIFIWNGKFEDDVRVVANWSGDDDDIDEEAFITTMNTNNHFYNAQADIAMVLTDPTNVDAPSFVPVAGGPALTYTAADPTAAGSSFFEAANFIGGVDPNNNWLSGWTTSAQH